MAARQSDYDVALSKLNESDARIAALTEQLAVSGQNMKSAMAEVERLNNSINEATAAKSRDEGEIAIAQSQLQQRGEIAEPDHSRTEVLRNQVSVARTAEVEARLAVRTIEERVDSVAARALALEQSAQSERDASERAIVRRSARARAAVISQAVAEAAYEVLIHIERSIAKAQTERSRLENARTEREGETLTVRARNRELTQELDQLTSSVHRDEIARAEQRMRVEALQTKAVEELGIDELFGALLEDTTDIPVVQVVDEENLKLSAFDENSLEHTQPITYVREEAVEAAIIDKHVVVEETAVEEVIEDAHVIAERVLSEISVDGELFATTISETAGAEPIPQMFGFAEVSEPLPAPVAAAPVSTSLVGEELIEEAVAEDNFDIFEQAAVETIADVVVEEVMVEDVIVEEVVEIVDAPQLRMNNPINSFAPRLTFDELVFGVKSDD